MRSDQLGTLVIWCIEGFIFLPSYIVIIISHDKVPYKPIVTMECGKGFERCSFWMDVYVHLDYLQFSA